MKTKSAVTILDYGVGNLGSIGNMFRRLGVSVEFARRAEDVLAAKRLVVPGVGAFDHGMESLLRLGLVDVIREFARSGSPLLGICLGMQLLGESSAEGKLSGLGLINAKCSRFVSSAEAPLLVPHMGWNTVEVVRSVSLFEGAGNEQQRFYFTHSYYMECDPAVVVGVTEYGAKFVSAVADGNIMGVQFHPEKSHRFGMGMLQRFGAIPC